MIHTEVIPVKVQLVWEHNGDDTILYAQNLPGAFARGSSLAVAQGKMEAEIRAFRRWAGEAVRENITLVLAQEKRSSLNIADADSDVIFDTEREPLTREEYEMQKALVLKSAADFQTLYDGIPDKNTSILPVRKTFYGPVPRTAEEMYVHTKNVNEYYFWEVGVDTDNAGTMLECRARGFEKLEQIPGFLDKGAVTGSYDEEWSLRKLLRRFLWHDRIHGKAMYRMALRTFGKDSIPDVFRFEK